MGMRDADAVRLLGYWLAVDKAGHSQRRHALGEWVAGWPDDVVAVLSPEMADALCIGPATLATCRAAVPPERRRKPAAGELSRWPG